MGQPSQLYQALGGAAGCRALSRGFYARVEQDPVLRPFFPSTFKCAIDEFSAFLVQFLGGESDAMQHRWQLSLRESHARLPLGERERNAWLRAMTATLHDASLVPDAEVRRELLAFFQHSSTYIVRVQPAKPLTGEAAPLWDEQLALEELVALVRVPNQTQRCIDLLEGPVLRARFERSPSVHASILSLLATSENPALRDEAIKQLRANPSLVHERYKQNRTLLHDAAGSGDVKLVELLLDLGAGATADPEGCRTPLYCVGNECTNPGGAQIVRLLLERSAARVNAKHGAKDCTALHMAARRGNVDVIAALLDGGADIEARDSAGDTPLRRAVNLNKVEAAKLLLAKGADPNSLGSKATTPARAARSPQMKQLFSLRGKRGVVDAN
ncbi:MAG TPA: ankyrin repeat domain-containing protein [Bryobacteraceae bacterium]